MKKIYQSKTFKKHNSRRSKRAMKKLSRRKKIHKNTKPKQPKRLKKELTAPEILSVVDNDFETISFLTSISKCIDDNNHVYVNLHNVKQLTPESILYILLLLTKAQEHKVSFSGNAPSGKYAFEVFIKSGFYNYVKSNLDTRKIALSENILQIQKGKITDGQSAAKLKKFVADHFKSYTPQQLRALYTILVECMSNTNKHADNVQGKKTWWTMAVYNENENKMSFAFVDNGQGIPHTVRRNFKDFADSDADLIEKACYGGYNKSQTGQKHRNKGLPQIKSFCDLGIINNLVFVSNTGYYSVSNKRKIKLRKQFQGTIIYWEFI